MGLMERPRGEEGSSATGGGEGGGDDKSEVLGERQYTTQHNTHLQAAISERAECLSGT